MAYTDPPASIYSKNVIVNTVGLTVNSAGSTTCFYPNQVKVTRRSLSTSIQPVSIVVTGGFDWSSVVVNDNTNQKEEDVPEGIFIYIKKALLITAYVMIVILVVA